MTEVAAIRILLLGFLLALVGPYFRRKFYMYPLAGEAFVREGAAGIKIVREREGCWFFRPFHNITIISTCTHRVILNSRVITRDARWVILEINFFIRVIGDDRSLQSAAVTLGGGRTNPIRYVTGGGIAHALGDRLNSATRRAAALVTRDQAYTPTEWTLRIQQEIADDLDRCGLLLENITLSNIRDEIVPTFD